jgi:hypothetical protein
MQFVMKKPDGSRLFCKLADGNFPGPKPNHSTSLDQSAQLPKADFKKLSEKFRQALSEERLLALSQELGVPSASLQAVEVGWATLEDLQGLKASGANWVTDRPEGAFAFPERDGAGHVIGFLFRAKDGRKGSPSGEVGSKRGLIISIPGSTQQNPVLIVEGASDAAACHALKLYAVGRPSNTSGVEQLAKLLKSREVIVVGENDQKPNGSWPGRNGAEQVAVGLATAWKKEVNWALPPEKIKDIRDFLKSKVASGLDLQDSQACHAAGQELLEALLSRNETAEKAEEPKCSDLIVQIALETYRFGRTEKEELFAVELKGPNIAIMMSNSRNALRAKLARACRQRTGKTPNSNALIEALNVLTGEALDAEPETLDLRIANYAGGIAIDMGNNQGQAIIVDGNGWRVVERSPVLFRRTALTAPFVLPEEGGELEDLRQLINVSDENWPLIVGFLLGAFFVDNPKPILLLLGVQGTGKSYCARILVSLTDPSTAPLRSEPRNLEQWQVAAAGSWVVALDNLSQIPSSLADALCRASTGEGSVTRKHYSDTELIVFAYRRVIILTSIDPGALRGDLGERLVSLELEPITEALRRTEQDIAQLNQKLLAKIFGALLNALVKVMKRLPQMVIDRLPRMADFARILAAADAVDVTQGAFAAFKRQQGKIAYEVLEADPFASALLEFMQVRTKWSGTATELLKDLSHPVSNQFGSLKPNSLKGILKRLMPALTAAGITIDFGRDLTPNRTRMIRIEKKVPTQNCGTTDQDVQPSSVVTTIPPDNLDDLDDLLSTVPVLESNATDGKGDDFVQVLADPMEGVKEWAR